MGEVMVGSLELTALTDYRFVMPTDVAFPQVPGDAWATFAARYPDVFVGPNELDWRFTVYLLRSATTTILVDGGVGPRSGVVAREMGLDGGRLLDELEILGVAPGDIDLVILTHLHRDHVGWSTVLSDAGMVATFPNARYLAHEDDWREFSKPEWTHFANTVQPLATEGRIELVSVPDYPVMPGVTVIHTPGHTPGSVTVLVDSPKCQAFLVGDVFGNPAQLVHTNWGVVWDIDPEQASRTRRTVVDRLTAAGTLIGSAHLGLGKLLWRDGERGWEAV